MAGGLREPAGQSSLRGRAKECALLDELVLAIRRGESRSLVLRGEAGIGKSALIEHLIASASNLTIVRAVGVESDMELAYASLQQLCAPLLDGLERLPAPQRQALQVIFGLDLGDPPDRFLVGLGVLSLLAEVSEHKPLLCVIDDAQWLDQGSALTLAFVARRLLAESIGIVFATREPSGALQHLRELAVPGLRVDDARALLNIAVPFKLDEHIRERIVAETHGNPLALLELPRGQTATQLAGGFGLVSAQGLSRRIEESYARQLEGLDDDTRRLLLLAAAEPVGDPVLLYRAAERLGIPPTAAEAAQSQGLLAIGERVTIRHPLLRSVIYRSESVLARRAIHLALAHATDREADPDRRAWHLAAAAAGPDELIASELERSAGRAQARGGLAAAAAFLARTVALTPDPRRRVERALTAAHASLHAGAFEVALRLLTTAETGELDALARARADLLHAEIAFAAGHGGTAPARLLRAVQAIEPLDASLARGGYLQALSAALFAARLAAPGGGTREVARALRATGPGSPRTVTDILLAAWAEMFADGCAAAVPALREALAAFESADEFAMFWLATITAPVVWDAARWDVLSRRHVELTRGVGALGELPLALQSRSFVHLFRGELGAASALIEEARGAIDATGASLTPWGAIALAALRGREEFALFDAARTDASERGEGISLTVIAWAQALLYNGLGVHEKAFVAARDAIDCPTNSAAAAWALTELVEAAARVDELAAAREAAERFEAIARACETDWAVGVNARIQALVSADAEPLFREALARLQASQMRVDLARTHLLYGEWLRRENRHADAREQLRTAHEMLTAIGMEAFAERARNELRATGEKARKRTVETRDDLTPQERQIARLARDGLSNPDIGARLFLSPRTVEWHLRNVFTKLGIRSRNEIATVLDDPESELTAA